MADNKYQVGPTTKAMMDTLDKGIEVGKKAGSVAMSGAKKAVDAVTIDPDKLRSRVSDKWKEWATKKPLPEVK